MSLEERNSVWRGEERIFLQTNSRTSSPRVWSISVDGKRLHYMWGQLNGAMQEADEFAPVVNAGKKNEVSAEANALALALRKIELKSREGYREIHNSGTLGANVRYMDQLPPSAINFSGPLPTSLAFYKPLNSAGAGLLKKAEKGEALYVRKYNGMMHVIVSDDQGMIQVYSRRMLRQHDDEQGSTYTWNDRFQPIVQAASKIMPTKSILLGELVVQDAKGRDYFKEAQSITKSLTPQSIQDQQRLFSHGLRAKFIIWDIAFWEGEDLVSRRTIGERLNIMHELEYPPGDAIEPAVVYPSSFFSSPDNAVEYAKSGSWEGFVIVDPQGIYGDKAYNFKGKPDRPGTACAKLKPSFEDDFIVMWDPNKGWGEHSTKGRYDSGIKCVALYQLNSKGEMVYISNLSSGMTEVMKRDWANPKLYPQVWKVEYKDRTYQSQGDDTNALTFAAFVGVRTDKGVAECINPLLD